MSTISNTITHGIALGTSGTYASPLTVTSTGYLINPGVGDAIYANAAALWTLVNDGTVRATSTASVGVDFTGGGTVRNGLTGLIAGGSRGILIGGDTAASDRVGTVTNLGTIAATNTSGSVAVGLAGGGVIINGQSGATAGLINSGDKAVVVGTSAGGTGTITNYGSILAGTVGLKLYGGGIVTNSGTIAAGVVGIEFRNTAGTVSNAGRISGFAIEGIRLWNGGTVSNQPGGVISGFNFGIQVLGAPGYVTNVGQIAGTGSGAAVVFYSGGSLDNQANGTIVGPNAGVASSYVPMTIINAGTITGGSYGLRLSAGGTVQTEVGGSISGTAKTGVYITGAAGTVINAGTIVGSSSGLAVKFGGSFTNRVIVNSGAVFGGTLTGGSGTDTLELAGSAGAPAVADYNALGLSGFEQVLFGSGNFATLRVSNNAGTLPVTISGFDATTETIDLTGIGSNGQITSDDNINHRVTITGSLGSVTLQLDVSDGAAFATAPDGTGGTDFTIACFCRGTLIRTPSGEMPVEMLAIGDEVTTLSGRARPIRWIGRRAYDSRFIRGNRAVLPIRVSAGALAPGVPARDLWLSPAHSLFRDGVLVPVNLLLNGASVVQAGRVERVEYFHLELDEHDIVFADGAPVETFVDCDNRLMFANGSEYAQLYPEDDRPRWRFCAPRLDKGASELTAIRAVLLAQAERQGLVTRDPDLHLLVDGIAGPALSIDRGIHRFAVPAGSSDVRIASRGAVPAEIEASSPDRRRLGVPVRRIVLRGAGRRIEIGPDCDQLRDGFHADEGSHRWTDGDASLPPELLAAIAGDLTVEVHIAATELHYPIAAPVALDRRVATRAIGLRRDISG